MRFRPTPRPTGYIVTSRKVAAFEAKKRRQLEALPLFAEATAATHISADAEMERRKAAADRSSRDRRSFIAQQWRDARADYYTLPRHVRDTVAAAWRRWTGPLDSSSLIYQMKQAGAAATAEPDDYPHIEAADRLARTVRFNDLARENSPYARADRVHSPGVMLWLSPFFEPTPDVAAPRMYLDTSSALAMKLHYALAAFADFGHNSDPSGEHRSGIFTIDGTAFRFHVAYRRHESDEESRVPWDTYLTRRVFWIGLADEPCPYQ